MCNNIRCKYYYYELYKSSESKNTNIQDLQFLIKTLIYITKSF